MAEAPPPPLNPPGLAIVIFAGGFDRVHYGLAIAAAAAAINRPVTLLFSGRAVLALTRDRDGGPGWHRLDPADDGTAPLQRNALFAERGVATFEELLEACPALNVRILVCEMALQALDLTMDMLRPDLRYDPGGIVTFLNGTQSAQPLFI